MLAEFAVRLAGFPGLLGVSAVQAELVHTVTAILALALGVWGSSLGGRQRNGKNQAGDQETHS
jgi:hypothetical protein